MRILLVYNRWEWKPLAVLSLLIRMVTYGPNHAAILSEGFVYEMVGSSLMWCLRKALGFKVSYEPNQGSGYKCTPYHQWISAASRKVLAYEPLVPVCLPEVAEGYGFLDLWQIFWHIVRTKWLLIGHPWNGKDGTRLWPGIFCSEYVTRALKIDAVLTPSDLQWLPELVKVAEFETYKK